MPIVLTNTATTRTYELTGQSVITKVRHLTQDKDAPYRSSDSELMGWLNDAISTLVSLVPQQFTKIGSHTCSAGYRQTLANARSHSLVDVIGVPLADLQTLTQFAPGWQTAAQGAIQNWLRPVNEPLSFYCYPPSADGQTLQILYVEAPDTLASPGDLIPVPETYEPALVGYVTSMAESKDDEHVDMNRAKQFMVDFVGRVKG